MSTRKTLSERIDEQLAKKAQMEAEIKRLQQQQKDAERKARTHRLIVRGGMMESLLPDSITLTDEQFMTFLKRTVANSFGQRALADIAAGKDAESDTTDSSSTAAKPANTAPRPVPTPNTKPAQAQRDNAQSVGA